MTRSAARFAAACASLVAMSAGVLLPSDPAHAAKTCRTCRDTAAPAVSVASPAAGATVSGSVTISGTSSDNVGVTSVALSVDGGTWQSAAGTTAWSWSWKTAGLGNGPHSVTVRATDAAGNATVASRSLTVANPVPDTTAPTVAITTPASGSTVSGAVTVQGTAADDTALAGVDVAVDGGAWQPASGAASWSWSWPSTGVADGSHTVTVRATDAAGNTTTTSRSVTVANVAPAPAAQGTWVSPEGLTIVVNSAGPWTIAQIYSMVKANALDLDKVGPTLTINVQDQYTSQTQTSATLYAGRYTNVKSTVWLLGVNSNFALSPDEVLTHEYGHAWSNYWFYVAHQGSWSTYLNARWTTADGSLTLATDSRTGSSYSWQIREIVADDYRLLFGSGAAVSERPSHLNPQLVDPRDVPGLGGFLLNSWRTP